MFSNVQILCLGAAAVLDTVLLLAVLERRNRQYVLMPVLVLILGGWLWHVAAFGYSVFTAAGQDWTASPIWSTMVVMAFGLLLMPSGMLHGIWRIRRTGLESLTEPSTRYLLTYLPLLAIVPIAWRMLHFPATTPFLDRVWPFVPPYTIWLFGVNLAGALGFRALGRNAGNLAAGRFYTRMAAVLVALIALHAAMFLVAMPLWPEHRPLWLLLVMLSPVAPAMVYAYYVLRYDFTKIVVERSLVYAAIVTAAVLLHELTIRPVTSQLSGRFGLNFAIVEALLVIGLIVLYSPLRRRTAEALRYLIGERVGPMRDQTRQMAVAMSEYAARPREQLLRWFCPALKDALRARWVGVWLFDDDSSKAARRQGEATVPADDVHALSAVLRSAGVDFLTPRDAPDRRTLDCMRAAGASLAVRLHHQQLEGLVIVGRRTGNRDLSEEEASAAVLLAEQLAITLNVAAVQADRLAAERRALQNEKLGMLGLVASSIAHEVKNPLSSIRTIATLLAEELPPDDPRRHDVTLIREEIDRLSMTTSRLLRFARPAGGSVTDGASRASVADVLANTLHVMEYLARQRRITLDRRIADGLPPVAADEDALREIFVNLIANAIESAGGRVTVSAERADGCVIVGIADDGPGLPDSVRQRLFDPFVTTRDGGTGLGLYIVGRRVKDLRGSIGHSAGIDGRGTTFRVELPAAGNA